MGARGIAARLAAEGAGVVIADVQPDALAATAAELGVVGLPVDVSDPASVSALAAAVLERFGTVHVVCNNAGVGPMAPIADLTLDDWHWVLGVNLWGVIHGVKVFTPLMLAQNVECHIVNTASAGGSS